MMIAGEFNTPLDWVRAGDAVKTLEAFAVSHGGHTPQRLSKSVWPSMVSRPAQRVEYPGTRADTVFTCRENCRIYVFVAWPGVL